MIEQMQAMADVSNPVYESYRWIGVSSTIVRFMPANTIAVQGSSYVALPDEFEAKNA
jgi:hypothetical protein